MKNKITVMPGLTLKINRFSFILQAVILSLLMMPATAQLPGKKVNILLIIADDMSPNAGVYGERAIATPGIDEVAATGVVFNNAFCTASSCTPSRASILSGKYPHELEEGANLWSTFPAKFPNYTRSLEAAGYTIGLTGKGWGPGQPGPGGYKNNPAGPNYPSFGEFMMKLPENAPFCFWIGPSDPHRPYEAGLKNKTDINRPAIKVPGWLPDNDAIRGDMVDYLAEVKRFDEAVETAVKLLKEKGLYENTLIIVSSDNGMPFPRAKANVYNSGSNVPLVMSWGSRFKKGTFYNELVTLADLAPTILEAAGITSPVPLTGRSLLPLLLKNQSGERFNQVFLERERHANVRKGLQSYPVRAIRTKEYLYVENIKPGRWPAGDPDFNVPPSPFGDIDNGPSKEYLVKNRNNPELAKWVKASLEKRPARELYILQTDPDQMNNVADSPANARIIKELKKKLDDWRKQTRDPLLGSETDIFDSYPYYGRQLKTDM